MPAAAIARARYAPSAIALHWGMALLIVAVYGCMLASDNFPRGSEPRTLLRGLHYSLGLLVLPLACLRLALVARQPRTAIVPVPAVWQERLAHWMKVALYALMLAMPLLGWLSLAAKGTAVAFFGLPLPSPLPPAPNFAHLIKEVHEAGATVGYGLVGAHTAAALVHHHVLRDNTLRRMLPGRA
ncbi:cytochrome b [Pseudacidovorax sp. RU35E]|uniref:cytochrome b n=1 Tax=Pseudacidovorax sp. RU35E TaxID=1907403 RepID=UPI000954C0A4|nr:cytochrome b [Pseudacidovorax sp. RU35E]SIR56999.1 cytochrome b561 [Pseudacidovorax sp. RU35E]